MSNLLSKASILLTPTATSDGKLHNIKPNTTTGDFTFTRGTVATRVNSSGLIESVASGLPRIDFTGGIGQILLEPASTNTATYSNDFTQGDIFGGSGNPSLSGAVLSANQGTAPDGTNTAQKLLDNNDGSSGSIAINFFSTNITAETDSTISVFAKKNGANVLRINMTGFDSGRAAFFDLVNGTKSGATQSTIEDYGNGWFKCSVTMNTTTDTVGAVLFNVCSDSNQTSITRDGTKSILLWGMQAEEQSFPTSYLPTSGGFVSRNKDEANSSGDTSLINTVEGVLYTETACLADGDNNRAISVASDNTNYASIQYNPTTNRILGRYRNAGSFVAALQFDVTDRTQFSKIAFRYKQDDFALFVNGVKVASSTSGSVLSADTFTSLNFGTSTTANLFEGKAKTVAVFKEFLTDAQLISLTS